MIKLYALAVVLAAAAVQVAAQTTPAGLWRTIDDQTQRERSQVRIVEQDGVFSGRIVAIADPARQDARCDACTDARKGQPVLGMTIVEGVRRSADRPLWDGGTILDPNDGRVYRVRMTLRDEGRTLEVRGFVGTPLLGRTQTWIRIE
jgi:uncharacterized protein (DUF2147 family)